jgi:thiosulfate/3-mercaptopyruvate sulfurtransferase
LEPWEKVLVDGDQFPQSLHGRIACVDCHGGAQSPDKDSAHTDLIANPSDDAQSTCGACHPDIAAVFPNSLHATLQGYQTALETRSVPENHSALDEMFGNHCASCHTTCGECHVSQPNGVGGGLLNGHLFEKTPPMTRTCTACHGSRVGNEYLGKHEDLPGDVHFREARMNCADCHTGHELHGQPANCDSCHTDTEEPRSLPVSNHRYAGIQFPRCETCHATATTGQDDVEQHRVHGGDLSCQVCHSITYTSCDGCHVSLSEKTGNPYFETQATYATFFIGRNAIKSYQRPYDYAPVRHVPIAPTSYQFYGENLLPNFDALPTWTYATPHNIQLKTPQTETCNACHGNPALFLTADKVAQEELEANRNVIVESIPEPIPEP